jgi:hypothetical protein
MGATVSHMSTLKQICRNKDQPIHRRRVENATNGRLGLFGILALVFKVQHQVQVDSDCIDQVHRISDQLFHAVHYARIHTASL